MTRVLVIDDDEINNFTIEAMLDGTPVVGEHEIQDSGDSALEYLSQAETSEHFPNYIFVDINMPGMNGYQFLEIYQKDFYAKYPDTLIYMLSSSISESDRERSLSYECVTDYISKPLTRDKLHGLIQA